MSLVWISFAADILIDLIQIFGLQTGVPTTLLGITFLTWGNSVCDLFANVAVTKRGYGEMAITGCYSSPLFNTLIGLGASAIK
jgi:sodium/potassium/calcium exchanger 6